MKLVAAPQILTQMNTVSADTDSRDVSMADAGGLGQGRPWPGWVNILSASRESFGWFVEVATG